MVKFSKKSNINIFRIVTKLLGTLVALWAGGLFITTIGDVMNGTSSPFYKGLSFIGWTVSDAACTDGGTTNCITATTGSGILAVVGIIGIASVVMEFVNIRM